MIYDSIEHIPHHLGLSPQMDTALKFLQTADVPSLPLGRCDLENGVYYTVMECDLLPFADTKWEFHRRYIDIQYLADEGEQIGVWPTDQLSDWGTYAEESDVCFTQADAPGIPCPMRSKMFLTLFPWDAHRPCWAEGAPKRVRKLVLKVPV